MGALRRYAGIAARDPSYALRVGLAKLRTRLPLDYYLFRSGRAFSPVHLTLEVTHRCNLRCLMCDLFGREEEIDSIRSRRERRGEGFSVELLEGLCGSFRLVKPVLSFSGGEPLLHPDIIRMLSLAKRAGFTCTMTTNGTLLADKAQALVETGLDSLVISIDGPEEIHDATRGVEGTFARAREGARAVAAARRGGTHGRPRLRINCTITSRNFGILHEMPNIAEDFGAESIVFSHLWFWDREIVERHNRLHGDFCPVVEQNTGEYDLIDPEVIAREVAKIRAAKTRLLVKFLPDLDPGGIRRYYRESSRPVGRSRCRAVWLTGFVMPGGDLIPCLDYSYGNIIRRPFGEVWNGERAREFRRRVRRAGIFPACVRCCMLYSF